MQALVVDDSRTTRLILKQILRQLGFEVSEAASGLEGLSQLREGAQKELVLVDCNMPDMDGIAFVRLVRTNPHHGGTRLVMVSGDQTQVATALAAGADAFVHKPVTADAIRSKLELLHIGQG